MASQPAQPEAARRRGPRRGGSRCSHSSRLDVPLLDLGSNMSLQLAHERNGLLLEQAHSCGPNHRTRILRALHDSNADLSKAQVCGHCHQLTARLTESLVHHVLFAKGQLPEPVSLLRKSKEMTVGSNGYSSIATRRRSSGSSNRSRKEEKLLRKLDRLRQALEDAARHLSSLADNNGEGPSSRPCAATPSTISPNDVRLLVVMGASATMPREVFALDLIQSIGRCNTAEDEIRNVVDLEGEASIEDADVYLADLLSQVSQQQRDSARAKTSSNWERKLVRLLVSDERLEAFMGSPLAPTKTHVFLSAPASFRCSGWSARHHLDFDLDRLCRPIATATSDDTHPEAGSTDTSMSLPMPYSAGSDRKRGPTSPLQGQSRRWLTNKSAHASSSSVADSWPEDSASEQLGESSISSVSDDSRPPSAADKPWPAASSQAAAVAEGWLARCNSPQTACIQSPEQGSYSLETSRTGSSLGSSTAHGHDTNQEAMDSPRAAAISCDDASVGGDRQTTDPAHDLQAMVSTVVDGDLGPRRRSREPKEGSLLSRNLLRAKQSRQSSYAASDSSSVRSSASSLKRAPRCAGLQIDFTDPEQTSDDASTMEEPKMERCWFQCEVVLEGFR